MFPFIDIIDHRSSIIDQTYRECQALEEYDIMYLFCLSHGLLSTKYYYSSRYEIEMGKFHTKGTAFSSSE